MSSTPSGTPPVHSLHRPYHARSRHSAFSGISSVGAAAGAVVVLGRLGGEVMVLCFCVVVVLGSVVTSSWHPQNRPGDSQVVLLVVRNSVVVSSPQPQNRPGAEHVVLIVVLDGVIVSSSHPQNRPGVKHVVLVEVGLEDVVVVVVVVVEVVMVVEVGVVDVVVEEISSLQPNQPLNKVSETRHSANKKWTTHGVRQVLVDVVVVAVVALEVCVPVVVVVSSKQPHQPLDRR